MSGVLVIAETRRGEVRPITLELAGAGAKIREAAGVRLSVVVIARDAKRHARTLALIEGVDEVLTVTAPSEHFDPAVYGRAVAELIEREEPTVVLTGMSADGLGFAPAVATKLGLGFAGGVSDIGWSDGPWATVPEYGGKLEATIDFPDRDCVLLMVREGAFGRQADSAPCEVRSVEIDFQGAGTVEHIGYAEGDGTGGAPVEQAEIVLAVGRGIGDGGLLEDFDRLAERLGAALAVSGPVVEAGWASGAIKVGQSGKSVSPKVYLAMGISGAAQHLTGIKDAETIIAINTDREAPIFRVADYGAVADMFEVAEELQKRLD